MICCFSFLIINLYYFFIAAISTDVSPLQYYEQEYSPLPYGSPAPCSAFFRSKRCSTISEEDSKPGEPDTSMPDGSETDGIRSDSITPDGISASDPNMNNRISMCSTISNVSSTDPNGYHDIFYDDLLDVTSLSQLNGFSSKPQSPTSTSANTSRCSKVSEFDVNYESVLKRSTKLWKEIQTQQEHGQVDKKKIAALKIFL